MNIQIDRRAFPSLFSARGQGEGLLPCPFQIQRQQVSLHLQLFYLEAESLQSPYYLREQNVQIARKINLSLVRKRLPVTDGKMQISVRDVS
jgi:hypothetical protein